MRRKFCLLLALPLAWACSSSGGLAPANGSQTPAVHGVISSKTATTVFVDGSGGETGPDACMSQGTFTLGTGTQVFAGGKSSTLGQLAVGQTVDVYTSGTVVATCPIQATAGKVVIDN